MQRGEYLALDVELRRLIFPLGTGGPYSGARHKFPGESKCTDICHHIHRHPPQGSTKNQDYTNPENPYLNFPIGLN